MLPSLLSLALCLNPAQQPSRTFQNLWGVPGRAAPMVALEDIDGDGLREFLIGESSDPYGELRILTGASAELLQRITLNNLYFGSRVAFLGDVTGDGFGDFLGSGYLGNRGHLWDGATLERIWDGQSFDSAAGIGDIDGDGIGDFVLAAYGIPGLPGSATVYYGGRYQPAYTLAQPGSFSYGEEASALGDLDRDGIGDFAIGAPDLILGETCSPGEVYVYSGVDGRLLYRLEGEGVGSVFGEFVVAIGDVTGDGVGDLAVSAQLCCAIECERGGAGRISFFNGASGKLIEHALAPAGVDRFGSKVEGVGDLDGNGFGDVLVNAVAFNGEVSPRLGTNFAIDGGTRRVIYSFVNEGPVRCGYIQLVGVGDMDGDDFPDYYLSSVCSQIGADDQVEVFSGAPIGVRTLGPRCAELVPGKPLRIGATGVPRIGSEYALHLTGIPPGVEARLLIGTRAAFTIGHARRCPSVEPVAIQRVLAKPLRPGEGVATATLSIPNQVALIGTRCYAQWHIQDGVQARTSRILELEFQPSDPHRGR